MTNKTYAEKLKDPRWQKKRLEVFERDDWTCQECGDKTNTLVVHHEKYSKQYKNPWDYPFKLLSTLCEKCHDKYHGKVECHDISPELNNFDILISAKVLCIGGDIFLAEELGNRMGCSKEEAIQFIFDLTKTGCVWINGPDVKNNIRYDAEVYAMTGFSIFSIIDLYKKYIDGRLGEVT